MKPDGDFTDSTGSLAEVAIGTAASAGSRLGRFEIVGLLGAGAMGEVYRARDPQLQRDVAIKILPLALSRDPVRQLLLEEEARAAGSLNHPNIVAVYDVGTHQGSTFIVTELLDGETLRQRMRGQRLPVHTAIDFAIQIAKGLAAGHDRGVVHRDIKPGNLFVAHGDRIKILDFGLARTTAPSSPDDRTETLIIEGAPGAAVVGTAAYMSPEHARGLVADHRSDIFSLGAVLYEMLAGASPFRRATMADTISAILKEEAPDLTTRGEISPALDRIVRHCLEKEASKRFHSAHDLAFALEALPEARETVSFVRPVLTISRRHALTTLGVSAVAAAGAYVWGTGRAGVIDTAPLPTRSDIYTVHQLTESVGLDEFPALSPDGQYLAFTASVAARRQLFVRHLTGGSTPQLTTEAADHQFPRWMPDSSGLVYLSSVPMPLAAGVSSDISRADAEGQGSIRLVPTLGGTPRAIASAISGADINSNGRLVYFRLMDGTIQLVTASLDGTDVDVVLKSTNEYHRHPRWSTDGNAIAFQRGDGLRDDIFVLALETGQLNRLTEDRTIINGLTWLPDGKGLVYSSSRGSSMPYLPQMSLWRIGLDASAKRLTSGEVSYEHPDVSSSGRLVAARRSMQFDVWKFPFGAKASENMDGRIQLTRQTSQVMTPTSGPRGEVAFLSDSGGHANIWVLPSRTEEPKQVTFEEDRTVAVGVPVWSPDGRWIAFVSSRGRTGFDFGIWLVDPSGETRPWNIVPAGLGLAWSPDSQWIYYADGSAGALHKVSVKGGTPSLVSAERTRNVIGKHGDTLYLLVADQLVTGRAEYQIRAASPEGTPSRLIATLPASRVPTWQVVNPVLSPDGEWMAMPLTDGFTTNVWALHIRSGAWRPVTDFGDRVTFIARRVSWSDGGTFILASVGYGDADVFALENL